MKNIRIYLSVSFILITCLIGAQTRRQTSTGNSGSNVATTFGVTMASAPINGNTLIAVISTRSNATNTVTSITQNGATWVRAISSTGNSTNNTTTEIWYTTSLAGASTAITITQLSTRSAAVIMEYSGLVIESPLDRTASNFNTSNSNSATTGTTATTTSNDELWIGAIGLRSSNHSLSAITNSFTTVNSSTTTNSTAGNNARVIALDRIVSSTGQAHSGGTVSTSSLWSGAVATFRVATLNSFSPISACRGSSQVVTLLGEGFTNNSVVRFNETLATTNFISPTQLTATVPASATSGFITVSTSDLTIVSKTPFLVRSPVAPTATVTNTSCPSASDGSVIPTNIPIAVNFDNTRMQHINLGNPLLNNLSAFTLEGWIRSTSFNRNSFFGQNNAIEIGLTSAGTIELWSEGLTTNILSPTPFPTDGQWHHIAGTGDGTTMRIYLNGVLIASGAHAALPANNYGSSTFNTMIGGFVWDNAVANYHNGQILKVGFWNRALTNTEIAELASTPHHYLSNAPNLIAGYNFYEGAGTTLSRTPTGTNGTFLGSPVSTWSDLFTYNWTRTGGGFTSNTKNIRNIPTGTYQLNATFNGCSANSSDFIVTSNGTVSTAPTSITGTTPICSGGSSTLTVVGGTLGTSATWNWYTNSCGTTWVGTGSSITVNPSTTTTYFVRAEGSCNVSSCVSFTVSVNTTGEWLGITSTDWNTASNWCGGIPTASTDVLIPTLPIGGRFPIVGAAGAVCKSITIASGASLTMNGASTFDVFGNWTNNGTFVPASSSVNFKANATISGNVITSFHHLTIDALQTLNSNAGTIIVNGNWTNNGTFNHSNGTVVFGGSAVQNINGTTNFHNLTVNNNAGIVGKSDFSVQGVLNLASENPDETKGTIEMTVNYGDYSNVATPIDSLTKHRTQSWDILDSKILHMGVNATTIGIGDVTGKIKRTTLHELVEYSFGNPNTTITFNKNTTGNLPSEILFIVTKGSDRGIHANKTNTVQRLYQLIRTGGTAPTSFTLKLHYKDSELNANDESKLVLWDHHIPYNSTNTPHEHGKTSNSTSDNWVELSGHGIGYLGTQEVINGSTKYWMFGNTLIAGNSWLGADIGDWTNWNNPSNWTSGRIPTLDDNVIIPPTTYAPTLPENALAKTVEIQNGGVLNGGSGVLTIKNGIKFNGGKSSWTNNGTFNAGTSTVVFDFARVDSVKTATISGNGNFYNLEVTANTYLVLQAGSTSSVKNTFIQNGHLDATTYRNTFMYDGDLAQTIVNPSINNGYNNLVLAGNGTKTLPTNQLNITGNLILDASIVATSNTLNFNGTFAQTLSGTSTSGLNNVTINNANGLTLSKNQIVTGSLTLTNGLITTGEHVLTLGCNATTNGQSNVSFVNGKLARDYCGISSKFFPIGKNGVYRPITISRVTGETGISTVLSEQFESTIVGTLPAFTSAFSSRFWSISQPTGTEAYTIQLDGTGFTPDGTAIILNGNGDAQNTLNTLNTTHPEFTTASSIRTFGDFTLGSACLPPAIISHPTAAWGCESNSTMNFTVTPEAGTYTYRWEEYSGGNWRTLSNGSVYSNATTNSLTITNPSYAMNGFSYRAVVTRSCGGAATSNSATLHVYPLPQGSLSGSTICKGEIGFLTWTATSGTGPYTIVFNSGAQNQTVFNVVSGIPFAVGIANATTTYNLVSVSDANCIRTSGFTQASSTVEVSPFIQWTGTTSRDWQTASNWCGGIPTSNDNVIIPASPSNQPVISATGTGFVNSIIIENGASVSVNGEHVFNVSGKITNSGTISMNTGTLTIATGSIIENTGVIETQNPSAQPLPYTPTLGNSGTVRFNSTNAPQTLMSGTFNDIVIDNPHGVTVAAQARVTANGRLEIRSGSKLEIGTNREVNAAHITNEAGPSGIIIKSESGTPSGSLLFRNNENAAIQATVEMFSKATWDLNQIVNAKYKWQFIGIPVQSMNVLPTFFGGFVRQYNETGRGSGFLETNRWIQLQNNDVMEAVNGYQIVQPTAKKYEFQGTLYNNSFQKTLNYTAGSDFPGQHLIGNPYTAAIDISQITFGPNTKQTVYLYNTGTFNSWNAFRSNTSADSTSFTSGQYTAIPKETAGSNGLPRQIPSMQAFMVRTLGTSDGMVTVEYNAVRQRNFSIQRAKKSQLSSLRFNLIGEKMDNDVMWLFSRDGTTRNFDNGWDAYKLVGDAGTARIQAVEDGINYQINAVPDINETLISARAGAIDTSYKLRISNENMDSRYQSLYLLDLITNEITDISAPVTEYFFNMTNTSSEPRFKILTTAGITTALRNTSVQYNNGKLLWPNHSEISNIRIYNVQGIEIFRIDPSNLAHNYVDKRLVPGVYLFKTTMYDNTLKSGKIIVE